MFLKHSFVGSVKAGTVVRLQSMASFLVHSRGNLSFRLQVTYTLFKVV